MTVRLVIPKTFDELTREWMTGALRSSGVLSYGAVTAVRLERIGVGVAFSGQLARCAIEYDGASPDAPSSIIAKLPSPDPTIRASSNQVRLYEREVRFYEELASQVPVATPRRWYGVSNPGAGDHILLLEDLASARCGDSVTGGTLEDQTRVIEELAKLHGTWWEDPRLASLTWVPACDDDAELRQARFLLASAAFFERFADDTSEDLSKVIREFGKKLPAVLHRLATRPRTLVHGDCRLDNMLFGTAEDQPRVTLIDWQLALKGPGIIDIAYLLSSLPIEDAMPLLQTYHRLLGERDVVGYTWEQCYGDFRLALAHRLRVMVAALGNLDVSSPRAKTLAFGTLRSTEASLAAHNFAQVLSDIE